jgi:beta-1,4-mannosyltransferase
VSIEIINSTVYDNPYQQLLYSSISEKYAFKKGSVDQLIQLRLENSAPIYHIQWEDSVFARCKTVSEAFKARKIYIEKLRHYIQLGGKVVWTIHNIKPHEWRYVKNFFSLRKDLVDLSHQIIVHNSYAILELQKQTNITDLSKISVIPHPSYFNIYESLEETCLSIDQQPLKPRTLLFFGLIKAYKGIPTLLRAFSKEYTHKHQLKLHVCGRPVRAEPVVAELLQTSHDRQEITCRLEAIPTDEVAKLFRQHAGLVIPYHKVLTSGVAHLALSLGTPTVAPKTPQMQELFPSSSHNLLYNPNSLNDFRRAVLELVEMGATERKKITKDSIDLAKESHPDKISRKLGMIYDSLIEMK